MQTFRRGQFNARTEEERARQELLTLAAQLEEAQSVANVGSWTYSPDSEEVTWSEEMYRIYGVTHTGNKRQLAELAKSMKAESWDRLKSAIAGTLNTGAPYEVELEITRPDEARRFVLSRGQLKQAAGGTGSLLIGTSQDITELKRKEKIISAALKEKEVLLKEVQHRVKNNMQVISSLLRMQSQFVVNEKDARMFQESQERIRSMSLVYDQLRQSQNLAEINLREYINELAANLIQSYSLSAGGVSAHIDVDDISVGLDVAIPCGLLINELVSNSLKYAFPDQAGNINICIHKTGGALDLTIADNGIGLPDNFDVASSPTLGMTLLQTLGEQLGGKVEFRRDGGTTFHTSFCLSSSN
jgi:two-component system response regulator